MNKCIGCGTLINNNELCERCFRIKNYNEFKKVDIKEVDLLNIIDNINKDDLVVLVVDLLSIPKNFNMIKQHLKSKIILVLTKFDLMPTNNEKKYLEYFEKYQLNLIDKMVVSSLKNYNLDILYNSILNNLSSNKVYFIGYTNAGKSSLINKLIYNYSNDKTVITTSPMPNTTLDTIEIKLNDFTLIDTPGFVNKGNITNYLSFADIKKLVSKRRIKPINYQIKDRQWIDIDNLLTLELDNNNIIIYIPTNLVIKRYYKKRNLEHMKEVSFQIDKCCDIVITGLGFIKVMHPGDVKIYLRDNIEIFTRENII